MNTPKGSERISVSPSSMRTNRDIQVERIFGKIERYGNVTKIRDIQALKKMLKADGYLHLANVPKETYLLTILYGGEEGTSIKYLNDKLLGMEGAEIIIVLRQQALKTVLMEYELISDGNHVVSKYRTDVFYLSEEQREIALSPREEIPKNSTSSAVPASQFPLPAGTNLSQLDGVIKNIETHVQTELRAKVLAKRAQLERKLREKNIPNDKWITDDPDDALNISKIKNEIRFLTEWLDKNKETDLLLSFGISRKIESAPTAKNGIRERLVAEAETLMGARMREDRNRAQRKRNNGYPEHREKKGTEFDLAATVVDMLYEEEQIKKLAPEIRQTYFDENTENGITRWSLKEFIINALRKKHLEDIVPDKNTRAFIQRYYGKINRFDVIRPWPNIDEWSQHIDTLRKTLESEDAATIRNAILTHYKPTEDMTEGQFHAEASSHKKGYYLTMDAIGMGNKNALSFQNVFWNILKKIHQADLGLPQKYHDLKDFLAQNGATEKTLKKIVEEEMLQSGNDVTQEYYAKIAIIRKHVAAYQAKTGNTNPIISSSHSGDEYFVFIPLTDTPTWSADTDIHRDDDPFLEMLAHIQRDTGMRIAVTYKDLEKSRQAPALEDYPDEISEHQACLEALEFGIQQAKALEQIQAPTDAEAKNGYGFAVVQGHNHALSTIIFHEGEIIVGRTPVIARIAQQADPQDMTRSLPEKIRQTLTRQ